MVIIVAARMRDVSICLSCLPPGAHVLRTRVRHEMQKALRIGAACVHPGFSCARGVSVKSLSLNLQSQNNGCLVNRKVVVTFEILTSCFYFCFCLSFCC